MVNYYDYKDIVINKNYDNNSEIKCFLVYRLAKDKKINYNSELYQKYNPVIAK